MVKALVEQIKEVAHWQRRPSAQVIAEALETGVERMYVEAVLGELVRGRLTRREAIKRVGAERVRLAERQARAVRDDVAWGLHGQRGL